MALSNKQQIFIENYLIYWNATKSARLAGYAYPNVEGPKNLVNPSIKAEIRERLAELKMSADEVLKRLADMARADIADFADIKKASDLTDENRQGKTHVIKKFKTKITTDQLGRQHEEVEIELYDAQTALEKIGRVHALFNNDVIEHKGEITVKIEYTNDWRSSQDSNQSGDSD